MNKVGPQNIPSVMKERKQWVVWKYVERTNKAGEVKRTKPPFQLNGDYAKSNDPKTWCAFEEALDAVDAGKFDGKGYAFDQDDNLVGIDLDHCIQADGSLMDWAQEIVSIFENTYVEKTPSGEGLHIICHGKAVATGSKKWKNDQGIEVGLEIYDFTSPRYFTVTGNVFNDKGVTDCPEQLEWIFKKYFETAKTPDETKRVYASAPPGEQQAPSDEEIYSALNAIPSDDYNDWKDVGMALKAGGYSVELWDRWSSTSSKYAPGDCQKKWNSFNGSGLTLKTIFKLAHDNGWKRNPPKTIGQITKLAKEKEQTDFRPDSKDGTISTAISPPVVVRDRSQLGIARAVINSYGEGNLIFTQDRFYSWNEKLWNVCDNGEVKRQIATVCESINAMDPKNSFEITSSKVDSIFKLMSHQAVAPRVEFDQPNDAINCLNGELHLINGKWELRQHSRESYRLSLIPIQYDPSAQAPRFIQFLDELFLGDSDADDKKKCICQFLGYSLTTNCKFSKYLLLKGAGENGKSVLLDDVVRKLVGEHNAAAVDPGQFSNKFQRAFLVGKYVNTVAEISEGHLIDDGALKAITSGNPLSVEKKFGDPFNARPFAKQWLGTNHLPHTRDTSHAFFRRPLIIEFNRKFRHKTDPLWKDGDPVADPDLGRKLSDELPGILNLALAGLVAILERNGFTEPASSIAARSAWRFDTDQVKQCVAERFKTGENEGPTLFNDLWKVYLDWAKDSGIKKTVSKVKFGERLSEIGCKKKEKTTGNVAMREHIAIDPLKW